MKFDRRLFTHFDWTLLALVVLLSCIGLLNIYSTGVTGDGQSPLYWKQAEWIAIGLLFMGVSFSIDYRLTARYAYWIYGFSIVLLVMVFLFGYATRGSQRWIQLGSFSFQPSELVKLAIVLALSKYFDDHKIAGRGYRLRELFIPALLSLVPVVLIMKQPDLGTALVVLIVTTSMVFFVGVEKRSLLIAAACGLVLLPIGWLLLKDYQKERIMTFFCPERDPLGSGYHIIQSMIAVGSGGLIGKGFLKGTQTQLKFLPEQQTDFVFSVFAEEWGFLGCLLLIMMFLTLVLWGLKIALNARNLLGTLLCYGITMLIFWECFINIAMVLGLLPVVGIPLPFLSYGGSAIVVLMTAVGLLMNVSMRRFLFQP